MAQKNHYNNFYVVGIGASAGGLEALEKFFDNMPPGNGMAFIVVQHLSPDYKSMMVEILSKHTEMPVIQIEDGMQVYPNHIYLIPSRKNITIFHGKLYLTEKDAHRGLSLPIDIFFLSLAQDQGDKAIAIILSGTGSDGTRGIRAIKESEGTIMVQDPDSAKFDGMPKSAISTGLCDYIIPPETMPEALLKFTQHPTLAKVFTPEKAAIEKHENTLFKVLSLIREQLNVDFTNYKENTVIRRIERRMNINQIDTIEKYLHYLQKFPLEIKVLYKELLIGVTKFFRDPESFETLAEEVVPKLFEKKSIYTPVRVWIAGCSTGEEAYSIAILLAEYIKKIELQHTVKIFATDIDKHAIEYASLGVYPESIAADVALPRLRNFFVKQEDNKYQIIRQLRQMVIFAPHNLIKDPPFVKIDLVSCRNLFIYLQPVLQDKILSLFHFSLKPQGFLLLGSSESISDNVHLFSTVDASKKIYQYKGNYLASSHQAQNEVVPEVLPFIYNLPRQEKWGKMPSQKQFVDLIYEALSVEFIPPCIVTNENLDILHINGNLETYLKFPQGQMSINLTKILRQDISVILTTAAHNAIAHGKKLLYNLKFKVNDSYKDVNIHVRPLSLDSPESPKLLLIIFEQLHAHSVEKEEVSDISTDFNQRIIDLERELEYTRETLQATIEELETSNEELQATNEELLAANEELQSTNEELQAVNEELVTVNSEYQYKIQELTELNDDINNLLFSINIGTLFLDKQLCVKRYTKDIAQEINLIESDLGRPLQHLAHRLKYPQFIDDIKWVLQSGQAKEVEVENQQDKWFLLRISPYLTTYHLIEGVVITMVDITRRREEQQHQQAMVVRV